MTGVPGGALLGRELEIAEIDRLIANAARGDSGALALIGPAGAGKTSLLVEASRLAAEREPPLPVLRARGVESEAEVAFAGLLELVRPLAHLIPRLPEPQARALEGALALGPAGATDRFSVSAATLAVLALAGAETPVLVLVDDLHWLDPPSAQAILFAARRLWREGVAILASARPEAHVLAQLDGIGLREVGPLAPAESATLIRSAAAREMRDEEVRALVAETGGNPLAIVEAARTASVGGTGAGGSRVLAVADRIKAGVERRTAHLTSDERRALLVAAAAGTRCGSALLRRALAAEGIPAESLDAAERAGLLRAGADTVEFDHPLTRSAVYASASGAEQRAAHRGLAEASAPGSAERAWHLAAAAFGADEGAAAALEASGRDALSRGAPSTAVRAFDRAAALSEDVDAGIRRLFLSGDAARLAGDPEHARSAMLLALERSADPLMRADALGLLFQIDTWRAPVATARAIAAEVERVVALDRERAARMLAEASAALCRSGSIALAVEFAERARQEMEAAGAWDDAVELSLAFSSVLDARAPEVIAPLRSLGERLLSAPPTAQSLALLQQVAWIETWVEQYEAAGRLLDHAVALGRTQAPGTLPMALATRGELEYRRGRLSAALADTAEAADLAGDFGQHHARGLALTCQARIEAVLGHADECRAIAAEAAEIGRRIGGEDSPIAAWGSPALGLLALSEGDHERAVPYLERVTGYFRRGGIREPGVVLSAGDLIEAYLGCGRRDDAEAVLEEFTALARQTERTGAQAIAARCAGLLATDGAFEERFRLALDLHEAVDMPFERARTHRALAERRRAAGDIDGARRALRAAQAEFDALGAARWAQGAASGLGEPDGGESPPASPVPDDLTPLELRVAQLTARGADPEDAAAQLLLSAGSVQAHLGRVYRKLGVSSADELAMLIGDAGDDEGLAITTLGRFRVSNRGRILGEGDLGGPRSRLVVAFLLCAGRAVPPAVVAEHAWPEIGAADRREALDSLLGGLREALGQARVHVSESEVSLTLLEGDRCDVDELLRLAEGDGVEATVDELRSALERYSAAPLPEWEHADWTRPLRERWAAGTRRLRGRLAEALTAQGDHDAALALYAELVAAEPLEEEWHRGIMRCHHARGDAAQALRQYHVCRSALHRARGQEPDSRTRELYLLLLPRDES